MITTTSRHGVGDAAAGFWMAALEHPPEARRHSGANSRPEGADMASDPAADRQALVEVINLGLLWHCLCAITRLEVPERLGAGPLPIPQLAAAVGADQDALRRVLRLVADHHIVTLEGDRVGLTDRGRLLCRDHPSSLQAAFATVGTADAAHGLTETLRTGQPAAPRVLGMGYWDYLAAHPDQQALFDQAMVQRAQALSLACVPVLDWPTSGTIADIAGGIGTLLAAVLQAAPGAQGILVDQPQVLERARPVLERHGVADRCGLHPGDLFAPPPPADLYLLASVLHDWDDTHAARILAALARGASGDTRLRIFEMLLPEDATPHRAKLSDVLMLLMFDGARERTIGQYRDLLEDTGWQLERVVPSPGPMSVIQAGRSATS
jgi:O-methyltransferase domain